MLLDRSIRESRTGWLPFLQILVVHVRRSIGCPLSCERGRPLTDFALLADGEDLAGLEASDGASGRGHGDAAEEVHGASDRHVCGSGGGLGWWGSFEGVEVCRMSFVECCCRDGLLKGERRRMRRDRMSPESCSRELFLSRIQWQPR
jgi:hypothetical protein